MFVHLGNDVVIANERIIGIFHLENREHSEATDEFLVLARVEDRTEHIAEGEPKSFIFTDDAVFLSPISVPTLKRRAERMPD